MQNPSTISKEFQIAKKQAIEAEVAEFLTRHGDQRDAAGRLCLVRNGYWPQRTIQTGLGDVPVQAPQVRDRAAQLRFGSPILPPYLRRTKCPEELLPWLYLKGLSTSDFAEALSALLGRAAPGLSAGTISLLGFAARRARHGALRAGEYVPRTTFREPV